MPDVLIVYASTHGHTAKIAARIAAAVEGDGVTAHLRSAELGRDLAPTGYDEVIVGASVHAGHHQREVIDWARAHATALGGMPSAFFSVCLTAADDTDESHEATRTYLDEFEEETGWTPTARTTFAGALQYREYDFPTRLLMRLLMRKDHHPTDTSRDYDYTDWDAVDAWAHECAALVPGVGAPH